MSKAQVLLLSIVSMIALACAPAEDVDQGSEALSMGVYVSKASNVAGSGYIGDWEHEWGYVLGYLLPGGRVYAHTVRNDSVYGLITNSHYGAWDHGHHCGWVSLKHLSGRGLHSSVADICPPPDNDFSLAKHAGGPTGFRNASWNECDGCVQRAYVLPTCTDLTVYANYDPVTHTFHDPDGVEAVGRGTIDGKGPVLGQSIAAGYSGFGTRFVTTDNVAVEIKDTRRECSLKGGCTPFGFMHADCIAGEKVGNPAGAGPTPLPTKPTTCGLAVAGNGLLVGQTFPSCNGRYALALQGDGNVVLRDLQESSRAIWATGTSGAFEAIFQADGNLVVYDAGRNALWASHTQGQGGVKLALQDDGNIVLYNASAQALWSTQTEGQ